MEQSPLHHKSFFNKHSFEQIYLVSGTKLKLLLCLNLAGDTSVHPGPMAEH